MWMLFLAIYLLVGTGLFAWARSREPFPEDWKLRHKVGAAVFVTACWPVLVAILIFG